MPVGIPKSGKRKPYPPRTPEHLANIRAAKIKNGTLGPSPEVIAKGVATKKATGNFGGFKTGYVQTPEHVEKLRQTRLGVKQSQETIDKRMATLKDMDHDFGAGARGRIWTEAQKQKLVDAWADPNTNHTIHTNRPQTYKGVYMRSLSEVRCATFLDECEIVWRYEPKTFRLSWCTYRPDFYLPEMDIWIEVKGYMTEQNQRKIDSFRQELNKTLTVVTYDELLSLEKGR